MIMVILVHYNQEFKPDVPVFRYFQMGCPMFFVASGFGVASLISNKYLDINKRETAISFFLSRLKAILPAWYFSFVLLRIFNVIFKATLGMNLSYCSNNNFFDVLCNLTLIHGIISSANNTVMPGGWYIGTMIILYMLTPLVITLINKYNNRRTIFLISSSISLFLWIILFMIFRDYLLFNEFGYYLFLNHYPSYYLGIMLFYDLKEKILDNKRILVYMVISLFLYLFAIVLFMTNLYGRSFFTSWITALATYFLLYSLVSFEYSNKIKGFSIIADIGKNSLYIYLFQALFSWTFVEIVKMVLSNYSIDINNWVCFVFIMPLVIALSYIFGVLIKKVVLLLQKTISK